MNGGNDWLQPRDSEFLAILRSVSIVVIVFGHVGGFWFCPPWTQFLHVFVPIFFFISGAVSYNGFLRRKSILQYLSRRIIGLLIPYYFICMVALCVFAMQHGSFPDFDIGKLIGWITIIPSNHTMPFPLGQVWFLHTLVIISFVSPLLFFIYQRSLCIFTILLCSSVIASLLQISNKVGVFFLIDGHNLFSPIFHSVFFCLGFFIFDCSKFRSAYASFIIIIIFTLLSIWFVKVINIDINYENHTYYPDFYYMSGSISAIWVFILMQHKILNLFILMPIAVKNSFNFIFRHTFAIYLIHSFSIFIIENVFGLVDPQQKTILYGIVKLMLVLMLTLLLSPMFTKITSLIVCQILKLTDNSVVKREVVVGK